MGLDMYLDVERTLEPDSLWEREVLTAAALTRAGAIEALVPNDEMAWPDTYLPMWDHSPEADRLRSTAIVTAAGLGGFVTSHAPAGGFRYDADEDRLVVSVHAAYWRKVNAVHAWFVDHVQDGDDDCDRYPVQAEQLMALVALAKRTLEASDEEAARLLPPRSGFFFGGYEIDEWYREGLTYTVERISALLQQALASPDRKQLAFVYQSSW